MAIVTGAGRGIGRAIAKAIADEGACVVANDLPAANSAESIAAEIQAAGGRAVACSGNVAESGCHEALVASALNKFGRLDILVNNAAIQIREPFLEANPDSWDAMLSVNLRAPFFLSQCTARQMARQKSGRILNVASIHDTVALRNSSIYAITKGGLRMLTRALALELAPHGINVNAISPGAIHTEINREALSNAEHLSRTVAKIPLGRIGNPDDIVGAAIFLVSEEARYITGSTLYVDGGILLE